MFRCISHNLQVELKCSLLKNSCFYAAFIYGSVVLFIVQRYHNTTDNCCVKASVFE